MPFGNFIFSKVLLALWKTGNSGILWVIKCSALFLACFTFNSCSQFSEELIFESKFSCYPLQDFKISKIESNLYKIHFNDYFENIFIVEKEDSVFLEFRADYEKEANICINFFGEGSFLRDTFKILNGKGETILRYFPPFFQDNQRYFEVDLIQHYAPLIQTYRLIFCNNRLIYLSADDAVSLSVWNNGVCTNYPYNNGSYNL